MITETLINDFIATYKHNFDEGMELDNSLIGAVSYVEWLALLRLRSTKIRANFNQNEDFIGQIKAQTAGELSLDEAMILYDGVMSMYDDAYDDYCIIKMLAEPAIRVFEREGDIERLVFLYHVMGFESFEFSGRVLEAEGSKEAVMYFEKVVELSNHYTEIESERVRKCFFTAYNNMIAPIAQVVPEMRPRVFEIYRKVGELWNRPEVQKLDGGKEEFLDCLAQIDEDMLFMEEYVDKIDDDVKAGFMDFIGRMREHVSDDYTNDSGSWFRAYSVYRLNKGEISIKESIEEGIDYLLSLEMPDYDGDLYVARSRLMNFHNTACSILSQLKTDKLTDSEKEAYLNRFAYKVTNVHTHVPYHFCTATVNQLCGEWYRDVSEFLPGIESKKDCLMKLIICRQPTTYIHSLMVQNISSLIASSLIDENPVHFIGVLGTQNEREVDERSEEILSYISANGMFHDVGKCCIVDVISRQNRRLFDEEFAMIKQHPALGIRLLGNDSDFSPYFDVIRGHHVTYDRVGGYPKEAMGEAMGTHLCDAEAMGTHSGENLIVRDIVSIADSIDAATDVFGRNYTSGKTFENLLGELVQGAGTRYNPDIVDHIVNSPELTQSLTYLTNEGRYQTYYSAFRDILNADK